MSRAPWNNVCDGNSRWLCVAGMAALTGDDSQDKREAAIERLVSEKGEHLDYIFTVDIFNEGVDIPEINQVVMLRPTESPIVFVQQLGRGLRKAEDKEYVVILDFIGNYKNNFMIPIALSGDRSYNKDNIRRYVLEGERIIPGSSTIHFDEISKKHIFSSIDSANFSDIRLIKENYRNLKNKLGRIPALQDFDKYGEMDVLRIFDNPSLGSYYKFLVKYEKEYTVRLSEKEEKVIEFVSKKLASGKRIHELILLYRMLQYRDHFVSPTKLIAISKQSRTLESEDVQNFLQAEARGIQVDLFVRKNKDDKISKEFYYLGRMKATGRAEEFVMANTDKTAVEIEWILDTPVRDDIYEYIVNG